MQKKDTTKKSAPSKRASSLRRRAEAIIADKRYDIDTRNAILGSLRDGESDLVELVRRAERGDTILDVSTLPDDARLRDGIALMSVNLMREMIRMIREKKLSRQEIACRIVDMMEARGADEKGGVH